MGATCNLLFGIELLPNESFLKLEHTEVLEKIEYLLSETAYIYDTTGDHLYTDQMVIGLKVPEVGNEPTLDEITEVAGQMHEFTEQQNPYLQSLELKDLNELKQKIYMIMREEEIDFTEVPDATELKVIRTTLTWEE